MRTMAFGNAEAIRSRALVRWGMPLALLAAVVTMGPIVLAGGPSEKEFVLMLLVPPFTPVGVVVLVIVGVKSLAHGLGRALSWIFKGRGDGGAEQKPPNEKRERREQDWRRGRRPDPVGCSERAFELIPGLFTERMAA